MAKLIVTAKSKLLKLMVERGFNNFDSLAEESSLRVLDLIGFDRNPRIFSTDALLRLLWTLDCSLEDLLEYSVQSDEPKEFESLSDEVREQLKEHEEVKINDPN